MRLPLVPTPTAFRTLAGVLACLSLISLAACRGTNATAERGETAQPFLTKQVRQRIQTDVHLASLQVPAPQIEEAEYVNDDELCMACHKPHAETFRNNVHRGILQGQACEACHGPASRHMASRGKDPDSILSFKRLNPAQKAEICLKCHQQDQCAPGANWRTSKHAHRGVSCTDCHTSHYNVPAGTPGTSLPGEEARTPTSPGVQQVSFQGAEEMSISEIRAQSRNLGAIEPHICYKCHSNYQDLERIAHPHQIGGVHGFQCTTCHDPHGKVKPETRQDLCLKCHTNSPTMAWHSGTHALVGVTCTDCHNPHPVASVQSLVNVDHWQVRHESRLPMSVNDPAACYKCHPGIYAQNAMPSHHPIKEGKMFCSDCHDGHAQHRANLREPVVNMVCYKCHAEKQGPFAYEHPPVTENCDICHEPHGTVANNLLKQPATFLCLRCHSGHRTQPGHPGGAPLVDVGTNAGLQQAFYSDCTQCHQQVHGSDLPSVHLPKGLLR
ncbi:MAG: cytochrome c3 family protein [Pirellulales bacterium]